MLTGAALGSGWRGCWRSEVQGVPTAALRSDGTYLIAGELGGLECQLARWLVAQGARHLVLASHTELPERSGWAMLPHDSEAWKQVSQIQGLEHLGATVQVISTHLSHAAQMSSVVERLGNTEPPLRGVICLPGVSTPQALKDMAPDTLESVLQSTVMAPWMLHHKTQEMRLDFFVLFSSVTSVWGSRGLGHDAAAYHFLDALAHHRRALGLPALTVNWGPWAEDSSASVEEQRTLARMGLERLPSEGAIELLGHLLGADSAQVTVAKVDWSKFKPVYEARVRRPLLELLDCGLETASTQLSGEEGASVESTELVRLLKEAPPKERRKRLVDSIQGEVAKVLGLGPSQRPKPQQGFFEMGMDSLMAVELKSLLQTRLGCSLSSTVAFDYPTIDTLAGYLLTDVLALESPGKLASAQPTQHLMEEPIAIIGLGCRLPGGANNPEAFWRLLRNGVDAITEVPPDRWNVDDFYDPDPDAPRKMYTRYGGFLDIAVDQFDAQFFRIAPREAMSLDPQQRLLLEVAWEALENAGQVPDRLTGSQTGVFVEINTSDYMQLINADTHSSIDAYAATGNTFSVAAGRLSYFLGLHGPSLAVDTSCSSSLVSVHLACQSLRMGECDLALAGGVNLMLSPTVTIGMSKLRALSPDGRCKAFDASADGYGRGEGCGIVVLKRLSDAVTGGDPILALIRGSAVNQDGPSSGLTVPNGPAQQALIRKALAAAKVMPAQVNYVEAHGTGTPLGDPIEMGALGAVLGQGRSADQPLIVGSAKTNLGHLEAAAGVAGLIKVALALQHEEIPPHLHYTHPSPHIAWDGLPVVVPTKGLPWPSGNGRRIAGLSSFGFSGTNAHLVLEEAPRPLMDREIREAPEADRAHLLLLSARTPEALKSLAQAYQAFLVDGLGSGVSL